MTDRINVHGVTSDNATLLLAAAEELGMDASVVRTTTTGYFTVPAEVAAKAGFDENGMPKSRAAKQAEQDAREAQEEQERAEREAIEALQGQNSGDSDAPAKPAAKRAAAKKTAASKE